MSMILSRQTFTEPLLAWYARHKRDLPWRRSKDPYAIWVSEAMLQQTQVDTVIPYYERFMARYPTVFDLAAAEEDEVLKVWEGLGYYSRARNLQRGARMVAGDFEGRVPRQPDTIRGIPGVGPYMAGAILSIAYEEDAPAVDGNVIRVMARVLGDNSDVTHPKVRRRFEAEVAGLMPACGRRGDFTQALMELGALVCTPKKPCCNECPAAAVCAGRSDPGLYPVKPAKPPVPTEKMIALIIEYDSLFLFRKRPNQGLLAGMWEFPTEPSNGTNLELASLDVMKSLDIAASGGGPKLLGSVSHAFSHRHWEVDVFFAEAAHQAGPNESRWIPSHQFGELAMPGVQRKIIRNFMPMCESTSKPG